MSIETHEVMSEFEALNAVLSHIGEADFISLDRALRDYREAALRPVCEEYERRIAEMREWMDRDREDADAQLSDAIEEAESLRAAIMGEDATMPTALAPVGTLAAVLSMARDWAEKYRSEDEDPSATQEMLNDAGVAIDRLYDVATSQSNDPPCGGNPSCKTHGTGQHRFSKRECRR